jgi:flagellar hook-associated protein 2
VQAFVTAFNAVNDLLTQATAYDASTHTAALLQGDAPTLGLQSQLLSAVSAQFNGGGAYSHLSDIGIQVQQGGDLTLTASTLQTALSTNLTQVGAMFSSSSATGAQNGIATTMQSLTGGLLDPTKGFFTNENSSLKSDLALNSKNQAAVNTRVSAMQAQLTAKYSALDVQMAKINNLNSYISQQVAQWNKSTTVY